MPPYQMPGQPMPGYQAPGQQMPGYQVPGQQMPPYGAGYAPPGGGPQYPFGPPPPRKSLLGLWIFLGCLGVAIVIGVAGFALTSGSSSSSSSSAVATGSGNPPASGGAASSAPASAASSGGGGGSGSGAVGSSYTVQDNNGDTYQVTLVKVIDPAQGATSFDTPANGKHFVGAVFTIKAIQGSPQNEDADTDAALVGSDGQTYTADFSSIAGYTDFNYGAIKVQQGDSVTGAVTFQVPSGVSISKVQWSPGGGIGTTVQWNNG